MLGLREYGFDDRDVDEAVVSGGSEEVEAVEGLDLVVVTLLEDRGVVEAVLAVLPLEVTALAFVLVSSVDDVEYVRTGRGVITLTVVDGPSVVVLKTFTLNRGTSYLSFEPFSVEASNLLGLLSLFSLSFAFNSLLNSSG